VAQKNRNILCAEEIRLDKKCSATKQKAVEKRKKAVNGKVGYDGAFMKSLIKGGNVNMNTHCDLNKTRSKEGIRARASDFEKIQWGFKERFIEVSSMASSKVGAPNQVERKTCSVEKSTEKVVS
jgi:hypothetical protein